MYPLAFGRAGRFRSISLLGEGGLGRVYRVVDTATGQTMALKTLRQASGVASQYLKREFRWLTDIRHPNIVELFELFADEHAVFFTMELVDAVRFNDHVGRLQGELPGGPPPEVAFYALIAQLAEAVAYLHLLHRVHRDLKPSNVLVTREGRLVVLDFDMAAPLDQHGRHDAAGGGSIPYMAPEQFFGGKPSTASDWYAVGVMIYEAIAERLPFLGRPQAVMAAKLNEAPAPLRDLVPGVAPELDELVQGLLRRTPADRLGAEDVFGFLRAKGAAESSPARRQVPVPFVGREEHLAWLERRYERARGGSVAVAGIAGESGIGKSAMVDHFLKLLVPRESVFVLRGKCHPRESVPYRAFDRIVDQLSLLRGEERAGATSWPEEHATRLFPSLVGPAEANPGAADAVIGEPHEQRLRAFRAVRNLLTACASRRTLVLWLDDAQWGDADSAALMREILQPPFDWRLLVILSYRAQQGSEEPFDILREEMELRPHLVETVSMERLGAHLTDVFVSQARDRSLHLGPGGIQMLVEARGDPLLMTEVLQEAAQRERSAKVLFDRGELDDIWHARIDALNSKDRHALELVAVAGRPLTQDLLLRACNAADGEWRIVSRLLTNRLARTTEIERLPAIELFHERLRRTVLSRLSAEMIKERHRELASVLLSSDSPNPEALVVHLFEVGDLRGARSQALIAAARASEALAFERAADFYRTALSFAHDARGRYEVGEKLADALVNAGRSGDAGLAYEVAAADLLAIGALTDDDRRKLQSMQKEAAEHYLRGGYVTKGTAMLRRVLSDVGLPYPRSQMGALSYYWVEGMRLRLHLWRRRPVAIRGVSAKRLATLDACWSAGLGLAWLDRMRSAAFQPVYMRLALAAGDDGHLARAFAVQASQAAAVGGDHQVRCEPALTRARMLARSAGDPSVTAFTLLMAGSVAFYRARWREARDLCEQAETLLQKERRGAGWELGTSRILRLASLAYLGEMESLAAEVPRRVVEAERRGDRLAAACLASGLPNLAWLSLDQPEEARAHADRAMAAWPKTDFQTQHYFDLLSRSHIDLYSGKPLSAWNRLRDFWCKLRWSLNLMVENFRITLHYLRGRCAAAAALTLASKADSGSESARWTRDVEMAQRQLRRERAGWAAPLSELLAAALEERLGQRHRAADRLVMAARTLEDLEMPLLAASAHLRAGALRGGAAGQIMAADAEAWMLSHGVRAPALMARVWIAGGADLGPSS